MAKKLTQAALAFSTRLQSLCSEVNDTLQVQAQTLDRELIITVSPQGTLIPGAGLLPFQKSDSAGNLAVVSRCPLSNCDITLADLTYTTDPSINESRSEEEILLPFELYHRTNVHVNPRTEFQEPTTTKKAYVLEPPFNVIFQPCSGEEARYVISLFNLAAKHNTCAMPDLLIYSKEGCHDSDSKQSEGVAYLCRKINSVQVSITCMKTLTSVSPMISCFEGSSDSQVPSGSSAQDHPVVAVYRAGLGYDYSEGTQVAIELHWSSSDGLLSRPPSSATVKLEVATVQGSKKSPVAFLFDEFVDLSFFVHDVHDSQSQSKDFFSVEEFLSMYAKAVKSSFEQHNDINSSVNLDKTANPDKSIADESVSEGVTAVSSRKIVDFLDFLWLSLKGMRDLPSIQTALSSVIKCIVNRRVHPYIPSSNGTKLALFIKRITAGVETQMMHYLQLEAKELTSEKNVLNTLAQLGISKIAKDLRYLYLTHDILPKFELQPLEQSTQPNHTQPDAFSLLLKYYQALDVTLSIALSCNIPGNVLCDLTCAALQTFPCSSVTLERNERTPTFKLSLPSKSEGAKLFASFCRSRLPLLWKAGVRKSSGKTTYAISSDPLLYGQDLDMLQLGFNHLDSAFGYDVETICVDM